jgi:hypothetical protein
MKIKSTLAVMAFSALAAVSSQGALVAYWNFNGLSITTASSPGSGGVPTSIAADSGTGSVSLAGFTGLVDDFAGDTLNAVGSDPAVVTLSLVSNAGNGSFVDVTFSTVGFTDIVLTFATRGTGTGYNSGIWSYSTDGSIFTVTSAGNTSSNSSTWALRTVDLTGVTAAENQASLTLRYTVDGATSTSGNNRIDNLQVNAVPEPSAALLGVLGLLGFLRRRR